MYITSIKNINYTHNPYNAKNKSAKQLSFTSKIKTNTAGILKNETSKKFSDFLHAYDDILSGLACKNKEGIQHIMDSLPVTINDAIIFHNCGENNNSIAISKGTKSGSENLTHIVRRRGNSEWSKKIVEEAYMVEFNSRLLSDFKTNYMNTFPQSREYISQEEIDEQEIDKKLEKLLNDLDPKMLQLRLFLSKNADKFLKIPDGTIPYPIISTIKETENCIDTILETTPKIPPKQLQKMLYESFDEYVPRKGNSTYSFKNLGKEHLTISFSSVDSQKYEDLKRLVVYNADNTVKKVFLLQGNKLVKNSSDNTYTYIANDLEFYNEKEILEESVTTEFLEYLNLYKKAALKLQAIVQNRAKTLETQSIEGEFSQSVIEYFNEANNIFNEILALYNSAPSDKKAVKEALSRRNIKFTPSGITMPAKENAKEIMYSPVKSDLHSNLVKFAVIDRGTELMDYYLIHNNNKIVKNFWPNSPNIIPQRIKYLEENKMPDLLKPIKDTCDLLTEVKELVSATLERESYKKELAKEEALKNYRLKLEKRRQERHIEKENDAHLKELSKYCKNTLSDALKNLNSGIDDFNNALQDIQQKVAEYCKTLSTKKEN